MPPCKCAQRHLHRQTTDLYRRALCPADVRNQERAQAAKARRSADEQEELAVISAGQRHDHKGRHEKAAEVLHRADQSARRAGIFLADLGKTDGNGFQAGKARDLRNGILFLQVQLIVNDTL